MNGWTCLDLAVVENGEWHHVSRGPPESGAGTKTMFLFMHDATESGTSGSGELGSWQCAGVDKCRAGCWVCLLYGVVLWFLGNRLDDKSSYRAPRDRLLPRRPLYHGETAS